MDCDCNMTIYFNMFHAFIKMYTMYVCMYLHCTTGQSCPFQCFPEALSRLQFQVLFATAKDSILSYWRHFT